jgi:hypothetical protein
METLAEDLFLLARDDATGRSRIPTAHLDLGLGGGLLLDLVLAERTVLVDGRVAVVDPVPLGDTLLDDALRRLTHNAKPHEPEYWVRHLAGGARAAVHSRLVAAGVLSDDDHTMLGVITVHHTHQIDDRIEHELVHRLHDVVVFGRPASRRVAAVVSLVLAVGLAGHLYPRSDRRAIRHRMYEIAGDDWVGAAVRHAIDAVNAALGIATAPN